MNTKDIDELKSESDRAEELYQQTLRARKAAIAESSAALKVATKARGGSCVHSELKRASEALATHFLRNDYE
jgi:hypothetical protein